MSNNGSKKMVIDSGGSPVNLSPMANLAVNFSDTSLCSTPGLRLRTKHLSMSNLTPDTSANSYSTESSDALMFGTPRLNRNGQRIFGGKGSLIRRLNSAPITSVISDTKAIVQDVDKENTRMLILSPLKRDISDSLSSRSIRSKTPLEVHDGSSQDSGFAQDEPQSGFQFAEPNGCAPKKMEPSPKKFPSQSSPCSPLTITNSKSLSEGRIRSLSFCSAESVDDGFLELGDLEKSFSDENTLDVPMGLDNLLNGPLLNLNDTIPVEDKITEDEETVSVCNRPPLRRVNSLMENYGSAPAKVRIGLFRDDVLSPIELSPFDKMPFKRPREIEASFVKRRKFSACGMTEKPTNETRHPRYKLQRSISDTAAFSLASAMHKSDLIADFSRPYALPVISGRHEDLKSITSETLADLINGGYSNAVSSFKIIDCRYPYEYEGGHIRGSINLYTKEQVQHELFDSILHQNSSKDELIDGRNILIFHCEFSLERGPTLYRFLRRCDRNVSSYPSLLYPEVYLLHGGYESFFANHKSLCEPCSYQPMVDPKHENDLKKFRIKSSSWCGDSKRSFDRSGLKRL